MDRAGNLSDWDYLAVHFGGLAVAALALSMVATCAAIEWYAGE